MKKNLLLSAIHFISIACMAQPGTLDNSFGNNGKVKIDFAGGNDFFTSLAVQSDGKIIATGYTGDGGNQNVALIRLKPDGSIDSTFGQNGKVTTNIGSNDFAHATTLQSDGKIIVAGVAGGTTNVFALLRYQENGSPDNSFGLNGKAFNSFPGSTGSTAYTVQIQADEKILIAGTTFIGSGKDYAVARYNPDGIIDTSFSGDGKFALDIGDGYDEVTSIAVQNDGKILLTGPAAGNNHDIVIVRLLPDGTPDTTFQIGGIGKTDLNGGHDEGRCILVLPNQKILTGGVAENGPNFHFALVRHHPDGTLDSTFGVAGKVVTAFSNNSDYLKSVTVQPDGKIVAAGYFQQQSNHVFAIARYNPDGSPDNTFGSSGKVITDVATGTDVAYAVAMHPGGNIIVGGQNSVNLSSYDFTLVRYVSGLMVGTAQISSDIQHLSIFPNPLDAQNILQFDLDQADVLTITLIDYQGLVRRTFMAGRELSAGAHAEIINIGDLPRGIYCILIRGRYGVATLKVVR